MTASVRRLRLVLAIMALGALGGLSGCFDPKQPNCLFRCGVDDLCPDGYMCGGDDRCHKLIEGALAVCEDDVVDSVSVDGRQADGPEPDASIFDGAPDGTPDANLPDGAPDANLPDARLPDAPLPPDAAPDAASPPDAAPDAAFVNTPPVLGAISTPRNAIAGDVVTFTVSATDPDAPPQVLTRTADWTGVDQNPYGVAPGATFTPATGVFSMRAGILGAFEVAAQVTDGIASDAQNVRIIVAASPVRLNEIVLGTEEIELLNDSGTAVDLAGWTLVVGTSSFALPAGTTIAADGFLVVHWNQAGTDVAGERFTGTGLASIETVGEVALFDPTTPGDTTLARDLRDFVKWETGTADPNRLTQAVAAHQWPSTSPSAYADATGLDTGESIARTPGANTETGADFYVETAPTVGAANVP